jgi:hypothetical protein
MMDRGLSEIESALLRISGNARLRADDIKYTQQQEDHEYLNQLDHMLVMVDKVRAALLEQRRRFISPEELSAQSSKLGPTTAEARTKTNSGSPSLPNFLAQGPK